MAGEAMSPHAAREYMAWTGALVRVLRQLGVRVPEQEQEPGPSLAEILAMPNVQPAR